jgi:hypothetical protein
MDALCDPRAFLSAQEKRAEQLKALGIEENDISKDVIQSKGTGGAGTPPSGTQSWSRSDDLELQRQRCKNLQRNE